MTNLEQLQEEALETFQDHGTPVIETSAEAIRELITHIYTQAIEDCRQALPTHATADADEYISAVKSGQAKKEGPFDTGFDFGFKSCREQTDGQLTALLPK